MSKELTDKLIFKSVKAGSACSEEFPELEAHKPAGRQRIPRDNARTFETASV
ncbi:MAG: hypothetical protein MI975_13965 [Cytophagales bacterium]|nr:hypothetical protein [Cytophagales bacterium]